MPTSAHLIYIPSVLAFGVVIGYILRGRAERDAAAETARREAEREARRAARRGGDGPTSAG